MIRIRKGRERFPFSKGILAKSIARTGLGLDEVYEIVQDIQGDLQRQGHDEVRTSEIKDMVCDALLDRGHRAEERHYRVTRQIQYLEKPVVVMIGGGTGVGKSTIAAELSHRLGITRFIGSDGIREIMRYMVPHDFMPLLHESSFVAGRRLQNPFVQENIVYAFTQQVNMVSEGVLAFIRRGIQEGLHTMLNGIHLVPGYVDLDDERDQMFCFHYILHLSDVEQHIQHIYSRSEGSRRDPDRYVDRMNNIRDIQQFITDMARQHDVPVIENRDFDRTLATIMDDVITTLEEHQ